MAKRSIGVLIFGWLMVVSAALGLFWNLKNFPLQADIRAMIFLVICNTLLIISLIYGSGILMLKEWARRLAIVTNIMVLLIYPSLLVLWKIAMPLFAIMISMGLSILIVSFFTRPQVIEQFK